MSNTEFVWTDELVAEFHKWIPKQPQDHWTNYSWLIDQFKASHAPEPPKERITVKNIGLYKKYCDPRCTDQQIMVELSSKINAEEDISKIKKIIEQGLNDDAPEMKIYTSDSQGRITVPQDVANAMRNLPQCKEYNPEAGEKWEVVAVKKNTNGTIFNLDIDGEDRWIHGMTPEWMLSQHVPKDYSIHSVRRISDNVVFTVGDEVEYCAGDNFTGEFWLSKIEEIRFASYDNKQLVFVLHDETLNHKANKYINNIRHAKKLPSANPLLAFNTKVEWGKMDDPKFPCLFVPIISTGCGVNDWSYKWPHAEIVECKIRGAGHYFKIKSIQ